MIISNNKRNVTGNIYRYCAKFYHWKDNILIMITRPYVPSSLHKMYIWEQITEMTYSNYLTLLRRLGNKMKQAPIVTIRIICSVIADKFPMKLWGVHGKNFLWGWSRIDNMRRNKRWLPIDAYRDNIPSDVQEFFIFNDSGIVLNTECHMIVFLPRSVWHWRRV